jgi:hypothetical protein
MSQKLIWPPFHVEDTVGRIGTSAPAPRRLESSHACPLSLPGLIQPGQRSRHIIQIM